MLVRFLVFLTIILSMVATAAVTTIVLRGDKEVVEGGSAANPVGSAESIKIGEMVGDYIRANPQVIINAFTEGKRIQEAEQSRKAEKNISSKRAELENDAGTPFVGNPKGDVVIVKFSDYNCGYCKRVLPDIRKLLAEDKNLKFVFKDFPILGPTSTLDAKAAIAAFRIAPEKYFEFHAALLEGSIRSEEQILAAAARLGIDSSKLREEMKKPEIQSQIQKNMALGQAVGVRGTPAFVIDGKMNRGAAGYAQMKSLIREARAGK